MSKTRVYELAKELGIDSKDLIQRLGKLGVAVKSHSSSLEDAVVERIRREFALGEAKEIQESRIKSTVIRRRAVRLPVQETAEPEPVEPPPPSVKEAAPEKAAEKAERKPEPASVPSPAPPLAEVQPEIAAKKPEAARVPVPEKAEPAVAVSRAEPEKKKLEKEPRKEAAAKAEPKAPAETPASKEDAAAKESKKPKRPVEIVMEEAPAKKRPFFKQSSEKKDKHWEKERDEERINRWKEAKKGVLVGKMKKTEITVPKAIKRRMKIAESIRVGDLAKKMGVKATEVINKLIALGIMASINQSIDYDTASLIAGEFGYQVEPVAAELEESIQKPEASSRNLKPRAPVVTVMGHVDHGKTSLLDAIRETNVIEGEAGGITQAIGAYHVHIKNRDIVFLDTPGHEAFTSMRARGAQVTDIVILVVAADDGVMEQTVEAINHAKAAKVPIIVAVNKMDKQGANPERILREIADHGLVSEEWGGDTLIAKISAKKKTGIEDLLELILLQADVMELKADPDRPARGVIIEAKLDKGRGPVATVLIQEGTLREGDAFVCRTEYGRVRALIDDKGYRVREAGPSIPVEVIGFSNVPNAGTDFIGVEDERKARTISEYWMRKEREKGAAATSKITLEQLYDRIREGAKELNVILKADVQGSIEALSEALNKLSTEDVKLKIIHSSTGAITETDVLLASASDAVIIGFRVRPDTRVSEIAKDELVDIKLYDIIYNAINDVKAAMEGLLEPVFREVYLGRAEVRETFKVPKVGTIAGSYVTDGKIARDARAKLVREGVSIYDGKILSLKRFKDDAKEVAAGFECGIGIENFNDIKQGDVIEAYSQEKVERKL
ncbi:MAG TPA: translation initiation factor IF-2 [Syntrophales bacterium]|nr:translation initiation factor IF-2 [Syntrophales bacterium]